MLPPNITPAVRDLVIAQTFPTPREIVSHAAAQTDAPQARDWLQRDERGVWECQTADLLERARPAALELAALADPPRRAALERERCERGPHGEQIRGRLLDRIDELRDSDLRASVDETFSRAARRMWRETEKLLERKGEPLASAPRWYRPVRCARLLLSAADLIIEGRQQDHCVASYAPYIANGASVIVSLNVCGYRSTVEIARDGSRVLQHRGHGNAEPPALCVRALAVLVKRWGLDERP